MTGEFEEMRRRLAYVRRKANAALKLAMTVPFTDDDRELLRHSVGQVHDIVHQLDEVLR